jgi:hypothetical protein
VLWRGVLVMLVAVFLTGTAGAQQFKKRGAATPASTSKPKATAKKTPKKKAPRKRTPTVKKKPRAKPQEARRPMP